LDVQRIFIDPVAPEGDANIRRQYAIQAAAWVWHPEWLSNDQPVELWFERRFTLAASTTLTLHVSGDERYRFWVDDTLVSHGPHRSDVGHWSFASFQIELPAGDHTLRAQAWALGPATAAEAQITERGGWVLASEQVPELNTGAPGWTVRRDTTRRFTPYRNPLGHYHVVGPEETIDWAHGRANREPAVEPVVVAEPIHDGSTGIRQPGKRLRPSPLPEMLHRPAAVGRVRSVFTDDAPLDKPVPEAATRDPAIADWQALVDGGRPLTVAAQTTVSVVIDPGDYMCAYPWLELSGGHGAAVYWQWAEALYEPGDDGQLSPHKGRRDAVAGKLFAGKGDTFMGPGTDDAVRLGPLWWQAGRMMRLTVTTTDAPLTLHGLGLNETRYPLEHESAWASDDDALDAAVPIMTRVMQMCAHETYMDCPYYEQMMYVGDTRLEMLTTYAMTHDDRLPRRGIELFDFSRFHHGSVAERYPSRSLQMSSTFALLWVAMVDDYARWRDDPAFVRRMLVGVRSNLEHLLPRRESDGLVRWLPGWSFVDWVDGWDFGCPSGVWERRANSMVNLLLVVALRHAQRLERDFGEPELAQRYRRLGDELSARIVEHFFVPGENLLRDEEQGQSYSEHAQVLALLHDVLPPERERAVYDALVSRAEINRCTVYFSHYLLETFRRFGDGARLVRYLEPWKRFQEQGFKTTPEQPEPSRSDCHAWGAHPLYHLHASLAGVRPDGPGFASVRIAPSPGPLQRLRSRVPHPRGWVETDLRFDDAGRCTGSVTLPDGVAGTLAWGQQTLGLGGGAAHPIDIAPD